MKYKLTTERRSRKETSLLWDMTTFGLLDSDEYGPWEVVSEKIVDNHPTYLSNYLTERQRCVLI